MVPYANSIIDHIKSLRSNLKENLNLEMPLVRLSDNELIRDTGYRVLLKNDVVVDKNLDIENVPVDISSLVKDLEEVIRNNVKELFE